MSGNGWKKLHTLIAVHKKYNAHSCAAFPVERWLVQVTFCPIYLIIYHKCVIFGEKAVQIRVRYALRREPCKAKVLNEASACLHLTEGLKCFSQQTERGCASFTPQAKNPQHHEPSKCFAAYNRKIFGLLTKLRYIIHRQRRSQ